MPTLKNEFLQFNDAIGRVEAGAKIYAYDSVNTTTPKDTYTSKTLASTNAHPVVADAAGRFPTIWLSGGYYIVVKDSNDVLIAERYDVNVADTAQTNTSVYFETLADAKAGTSVNGVAVSFTLGQIVRTQGKITGSDGIGSEWVVVAGGTGTADDDLYADLNDGKQIKRLFNQLYTARLLEEIADAGTGAQATARGNLAPDVTSFTKSLAYYIYNDGIDSELYFSSLVAASTWESVGPTGSGADNIWTDMDNIPLNAEYIEVICFGSFVFTQTTTTTSNVSFSALAGVSSGSTSYDLKFIHSLTTNAAGTKNAGSRIHIKIKLDSSNRFTGFWSSANSTSGQIRLYMVGFGA